MSGQIFCKYCKGPLIEPLEREKSYHESCFHEMIKLHPDLAILESLATQDRILVESLIEIKKEIHPTVTQLDNAIELEGWGDTRSDYHIRIELTNRSDQLQHIRAITLLIDIGQIHFDFTMADQPKVSLEYLLNYKSDEMKRIASYEWFFIHTIFDTIIMRHLQQQLPTSEFEYLQSVKNVINLPIYAFNHQFVFFSEHESGGNIQQPFLRLELDKSNSIYAMTIHYLNQQTTEQIFSLKRSYFQNLMLTIAHVDNPDTLYQKFHNINKIDNLFIRMAFSGGREKAVYHVFDYSSVTHLQLRSLGLWLTKSDRPDGNAEMVNYPQQASLDLLILDGIDLPHIQAWTVGSLLSRRNLSLEYPTQYDNLPENLDELRINHSFLINENKFICKRYHQSVKKILFVNFYSSRIPEEEILHHKVIAPKFLHYFPQAKVSFTTEEYRRYYFPLDRWRTEDDWWFINSP